MRCLQRIRYVIIYMLVLTMVLAFPIVAKAASYAQVKLSDPSSNLNMRSGPGSSNSIVGRLPHGTQVEVLSTSGSWTEVLVNGKKGYVSSQYLVSISEPAQPTPTPASDVTIGKVKASSLNVRSGPGTNYGKIGSLKNGAEVVILGESNGFYQIEYPGANGKAYASKSYITIIVTASTATPAVTPEATPTPETTPTPAATPTPTPTPATTSTPTPAPSTAPATKTIGKVTASSLNVRSGPGTNYGKIGSLKNGAEVVILGESGGFYQIEYPGTNGKAYASKSYITIIVTASTATPAATPKATATPATSASPSARGVVKASSLNVRSGPGTSYGRIGSLANGAVVDCYELTNGFYRIDFQGKKGYVSAQYLTVTLINTPTPANTPSADPLATPTPTPTPTVPPETYDVQGLTFEKVASGMVGFVSTDSGSTYVGPGASYSPYLILLRGSMVGVTGYCPGNSYYEITIQGTTAYIKGTYLKTLNEDGLVAGTAPRLAKIITGATVMNRADGLGSGIGSVSSGNYISILGDYNSYWRVYFNSSIDAYVPKAAVSVQPSLNVPNAHNVATDDEVQVLLNQYFSATEQEAIGAKRLAILKRALSLTGRITYFWGGKSESLWDARWGIPCEVTASGSENSGTIRAYGMDCSGFARWAFYNEGVNIGSGSYNQYEKSTAKNWNDAVPGDLIFRMTGSGNHVGIVLKNLGGGKLKVIHCSSSSNTVVISEETENSHFMYVRKPANVD